MAWLLAAVLLAGALSTYDVGATLLESVIGAVVMAAVETRTMTGQVANLPAALLLSSLP